MLIYIYICCDIILLIYQMTNKVHSIYRVGIVDENSINVEIQCAHKVILDNNCFGKLEIVMFIIHECFCVCH